METAQTEKQDVFEGFAPPIENWSKLPHQLIAALPLIATIGEMKVILYILRHTWGYQELADWDAKCITTDEFENGRKRSDQTRLDNGTGLSRPTIYDGLKRAVDHGFLVCLVDNTDRGRVTHYYRLRTHTDTAGIIYACDPSAPVQEPWHDIPKEVREAVYAKFQGRCAYCERKSQRWHYDHIVPESRGGPSLPDNLALACPRCNLSKNDRTPDEWGHQVIYYENDVKIVYRDWLKYFTGPCKESLPPPCKESLPPPCKKSLPRTEKETIERNPERNMGKENTAAGAAANPAQTRVEALRARMGSDPFSVAAASARARAAANERIWTVPVEAGGTDAAGLLMLRAWFGAKRIDPDAVPETVKNKFQASLSKLAATIDGIAPEQAAQAVAAVLDKNSPEFGYYAYTSPDVSKFKRDWTDVALRILGGQPPDQAARNDDPLTGMAALRQVLQEYGVVQEVAGG